MRDVKSKEHKKTGQQLKRGNPKQNNKRRAKDTERYWKVTRWRWGWWAWRKGKIKWMSDVIPFARINELVFQVQWIKTNQILFFCPHCASLFILNLLLILILFIIMLLYHQPFRIFMETVSVQIMYKRKTKILSNLAISGVNSVKTSETHKSS